LACAECDDSLPFSGVSSIPLWYTIFPATVLHSGQGSSAGIATDYGLDGLGIESR
jgi:hypothetical protein